MKTRIFNVKSMLMGIFALLLLPLAAAVSMTLSCPSQVNVGETFSCALDYTLNGGETLAGVDFRLGGDVWGFGTPTSTAGLVTYNPAMKTGSVASATSFIAHPLLTIPVTAPTTPQNNPVKIVVTAYDENSAVLPLLNQQEILAPVQVGAVTSSAGGSCSSAADCASGLTCDDDICCNTGEENVAGRCVASADINTKAGEIASALRDNTSYPTLLQKIAKIAQILKALLGLG